MGKRKKQKTGSCVCYNCEMEFSSPQGLWLHSYHQSMRTKRLSCTGCRRSFKNGKDTVERELICYLNCMLCDDSFQTPKLVRNHEVEHKSLKMSKDHKCLCIKCRRPFDSIHSLKEHMRDFHKLNHIDKEKHERKNVCTSSDKERTSILKEMKTCCALLEHMDEEELQLKPCELTATAQGVPHIVETTEKECEEDFTVAGVDLNVKYKRDDPIGACHPSGDGEKRTMEDIKPEVSNLIQTPTHLVDTKAILNSEMALFPCAKCDAKFHSQRELRQHSFIHRQSTKRHLCIGCGAGFEQSSDRDKHELECKINVTKKQLTCIFCALPFNGPDLLRNHENKHRPPKRCKRCKHMCLCAECDKAFEAVSTLMTHIRTLHSGSRDVKIESERVKTDTTLQRKLPMKEYNNIDSDLKLENSSSEICFSFLLKCVIRTIQIVT